MVGWTGIKQKDGWIDINMDGWMERKKIDRWMVGWMNRKKINYGWMDIKIGGMDRKTQMDNKQMDGWMDRKNIYGKQMVG